MIFLSEEEEERKVKLFYMECRPADLQTLALFQSSIPHSYVFHWCCSSAFILPFLCIFEIRVV
jgi:hypothetical protein